MKSSVQMRASDNPLYSLQFTWLESCTSITTAREQGEIKILHTGEETLAALPKTLLLLPLRPLTTHQGVVHRVLEGHTETGVRERTNFKLQDPRRI